MIHHKDLLPEGEPFYQSISLLVGKKVKDVRGYISNEYGEYGFKLCSLVFEDDTEMGIEGEHDYPYLVEYKRWKQPNFDDETLERLCEEGQDE